MKWVGVFLAVLFKYLRGWAKFFVAMLFFDLDGMNKAVEEVV